MRTQKIQEGHVVMLRCQVVDSDFLEKVNIKAPISQKVGQIAILYVFRLQ